MLSAATRLALALGLLGPVPVLVCVLLISRAEFDAATLGGLALLLAAAWAALGYLIALYLGVVSRVREGFRAAGRLHTLRHLRVLCVLSVVLGALVLTAVYLRYEIVATGTRGGLHYYLVWDRWNGEVKVEAQPNRDRAEARNWPASH